MCVFPGREESISDQKSDIPMRCRISLCSTVWMAMQRGLERVYEVHSGGIVDTLNDLLEKASAKLDDAHKTETVDLHNFERLKRWMK